MITTDMQLLLRAIRDKPDEDTPRLMLADEMEQCGYGLAANYVRESVEHGSEKKLRSSSVKRRRRNIGAADYRRWLYDVLTPGEECGVVGTNHISGCDYWDGFMWGKGDRRYASIKIHRGLPTEVLILTAPLLLEQAKALYLFPLTNCRLRDRVPGHDDGRMWYWSKVSPWPSKFNTWEEPYSAYRLPPALFDGLLPASESDAGTRWYRTMKSAQEALHYSALIFGRKAVA